MLTKPLDAKSDLWRFNVASKSWYWLAGPSEAGSPGNATYPPALYDSSLFVYNGRLWIFGGKKAFDYKTSTFQFSNYFPHTNPAL